MTTIKKTGLDEALKYLLTKYGIESTFNFTINEENHLGNNIVNLMDPIKLIEQQIGDSQVPLLYWRLKRKFIELKNILYNDIVKDPCLLRSSFIGNKDCGTLLSLCYREFDIIEYLTGRKICSVSGILDQKSTGNILVNLDNGTLCSIEISLLLPVNEKTIERHEIIGRRGTASDMVVDTQVMQNSLYTFTKSKNEHFTDYDLELFDLPDTQIDFIRSAFKVVQEPTLINVWRTQHQHLVSLTKAVLQSNFQRKEITL